MRNELKTVGIYIKELIEHTKSVKSLVAEIVQLLSIIVIVTGVFYKFKEDFLTSIEFYITLIAIVIIMLYFLTFAPYRLWKQQSLTIQKMQTDSEPGLKIAFSEQQNLEVKQYPNDNDRWLVTFNVQNKSTLVSAHKVRATIKKFEEFQGKVIKSDIRLPSNTSGEFQVEVSPQGQQKFRLFSCKKEAELPRLVLGPTGDTHRLGEQIIVTESKYKITISIEATDCSPSEACYFFQAIKNNAPKIRLWTSDDEAEFQSQNKAPK